MRRADPTDTQSSNTNTSNQAYIEIDSTNGRKKMHKHKNSIKQTTKIGNIIVYTLSSTYWLVVYIQ